MNLMALARQAIEKALAALLSGLTFGLSYSTLQSKYKDFAYPEAKIELAGSEFKTKSGTMIINDVEVELSSGYEASMARFRIYDAFDHDKGTFKFDELKKQVLLGVSLAVSLGYEGKLEPVFQGFVSDVSFCYEQGDLPYIEVTGMDIKGIMMASSYACQLTAMSYGEAVKEILERTAYTNLKNNGGYTKIQVTDTKDKPPQGTQKAAIAETVEAVSESDYEFVVKAAKKFNYEFFVDRGTVYFREAKSNTTPLMDLRVGAGIETFRVSYGLTGLVETIEVRSMDAGKGEVISAREKFSNDISTGAKAKQLIAGSSRVYIDPTVNSASDAQIRAASLYEDVSYRVGSLECECVGIPELVPGRFIRLSGLGTPVNNAFYVTNVVHSFHARTGFKTRVTGKANKVIK